MRIRETKVWKDSSRLRLILRLTLTSFLFFASAAEPLLSEEDNATAPDAPTEAAPDAPQGGTIVQAPAPAAKEVEKVSEFKGEVKDVHGTIKSLTLSMGLSRTLEFPFEIGPIMVTDDTLFSYRRIRGSDGKETKLLLTPKNSGTTDLSISDASRAPKITYHVMVTREDIGMVTSQMEELLGDIEGIRIKPVGGTIYVDGEILLPKDMIRIIRVVDAMKDRDPKKKEIPIRNIATISKVTMNIIAERIEREIGSPEVTARVLNNNIILEGVTDSNFEAERAVEIAKTYLPEVFVERSRGEGGEVRVKQTGGSGGGLPAIIDLLQTRPGKVPPPAQDVMITMNYVQLSNEYDDTFAFEWKPLAQDSSSLKYDSSLGEFSSTVVATISSLFPKLNTAKSHQHARVLKQEQIVVKDKAEQPAVIESSIDLYATTTSPQGVPNLQPVQVQNVTKVRAATIPGSDTIELGVQITLNSLLGFNQGAPIIAKNSIQTQVTIKNGESAALGGHAVNQALAGYNREPTQSIPGQNQTAGSTTPLFNMTRSKRFKRDKEQYVIFLTADILKVANAGTESITRKFRLNAGDR